MAVRFNCPVYTYEFILETAGVILDESQEQDSSVPKMVKKEDELKSKRSTSLGSYSIEDLKSMLEEVLAEENYEKAARIRDEINKRTQGS